MKDLTTREGFEAWLDWVKTTTSQVIKKQGRLYAMAFIVATKTPGVSGDGKEVVLTEPGGAVLMHLAKSMTDEADKNRFVREVQVISDATEACAVVIAVESWMVSAKKDTPEEDMLAWAGKLATHPERQEVVFLTAEHRKIPKVSMHVANILRSGSTIRLGPWQIRADERVEGRFVGFLRKEGEVA